MSWSGAIEYAESQGGYLLEINSKAEMDAVIDKINDILDSLDEDDVDPFYEGTLTPDGGGSAYFLAVVRLT